jgi:hypothetical protein
MTTTWQVLVDWDRNANYTGPYDDISSRVINAQWFLGPQKPYQVIADESKLTLTLDNSDKRFSPDNASSPIYGKMLPLRPVRIQSNDGGTVRTHWQGWIEDIKPSPGQYGKRTVDITCLGPLQFFMAAEANIELQENVRVDQVLQQLLKTFTLPVALTDMFLVGVTGYCEVGQHVITGPDIDADLDAATQTISMTADNWVRQRGMNDAKQKNFEVYRAINDVMSLENGKFLFDRTGKALFRHRRRFVDQVTPAVTITDTMQDLEYAFAGQDFVKNEVLITSHPRAVSENSDNVLWELDGKSISIPQGKTKDIDIKFQDPYTKVRLAVISVRAC